MTDRSSDQCARCYGPNDEPWGLCAECMLLLAYEYAQDQDPEPEPSAEQIAIALMQSEAMLWLMNGSNHQDLHLAVLRKYWQNYITAGGQTWANARLVPGPESHAELSAAPSANEGEGHSAESISEPYSPFDRNDVRNQLSADDAEFFREPAHNHLTRDIKTRGLCPACDRYHDKHQCCSQPAAVPADLG